MHKHAYHMAVLAVFDQEWGGGSWYWMHGRRCRGRDANRRAGSWEVPPRSTRKGFPKVPLNSFHRAAHDRLCRSATLFGQFGGAYFY